jgi:hypothetical protein
MRADNSRHRAGLGVFDAVDKQLHGEPAHADFINVHGGQGRRDTICQIDIVEAYHRQITRKVKPEYLGYFHDRDSNLVIGTEYRRDLGIVL